MKILPVLAVGALLGFCASPCRAVSPVVWTLSGDEWQSLERDSIGVGSDGGIRVARGIERMKDLDANVIWSLLQDGHDLLVATGDSGKLFRVDGQGKVAEVGKVLEPEITTLGRDGSGNVLVGVSPDGTIYRL